MREETVLTKSGVSLRVQKRKSEGAVQLVIHQQEGGDCLFHWGVCRHSGGPWRMHPRHLWPGESHPFGDRAVQTSFSGENGEKRITIDIERPLDFPIIEFALFFPGQNRWDNNGGQNYRILLPRHENEGPSPLEIIKNESGPDSIAFHRAWRLTTDDQLAVAVRKEEGAPRIIFMTDMVERPHLHWGVSKQRRFEWSLPPASMHPPDTSIFRNEAAVTPFSRHDGIWRLALETPGDDAFMGISFVLRLGDRGLWLKDEGKNFYVPLSPPGELHAKQGWGPITREIIENEMGKNSWTLMHRFNLCYELLDQVERGDLNGLAVIYVWLRFSVLRQLDWQRNYNTKPRELGHAQDRLTRKLAGRYRHAEDERSWIPLIMSTLGRGSDAQRVRDEVLNIMHRHHIKEVSGHFMEEWHQKLHNNTTPDDIVIAEALIAFLESDGNPETFNQTLKEGGVTRERLMSFDRPVKSDPDFIPSLKEPLLHDFYNFLRILKEVHSGTDLETAIDAARPFFDREMKASMDYIRAHRENASDPAGFVRGIVAARHRLKDHLRLDTEGTRDLIFLDLALEDLLRSAIESRLGPELDAEQLAAWVTPALESLLLSSPEEEIELCFSHWKKLQTVHARNREWSLHAQAVLERIQRAVGESIDRAYRMFQSRAEFLGNAFHAEPWTIRLFGEEVVRGRPAFILSILIGRLIPLLRRNAALGNWQVISRAEASGVVRVVSKLESFQEEETERPTILIAADVSGNEEIPSSVTGIVTPDSTDIVSHLAIRARNAGLLFATCFDPDEIERLRGMSGRQVKMRITASGEVVVEESSCQHALSLELPDRMHVAARRPSFSGYALRHADFDPEHLGGKSNNLNRLRGNLPGWICFPASVAIPFGVFDKMLEMESNRGVAMQYRELTQRVDQLDSEERVQRLREIREVILKLDASGELISSLRGALESEGMAWFQPWEKAWECIKRVWASKWNDRAWLNRRANGIKDDDLFMAVLIQEVVAADYSFVIHTANPFTGNRDELYAEVVAGLGEALVGNYPGRALSYSSDKEGPEYCLLSFPAKRVGFFGEGVIFRSDSNGEDLAGYAGAGLYDSFMLPTAGMVTPDYTSERLIWDEDYRKRQLSLIAQIGKEIERFMGIPQDIEGVLSGNVCYVVQTRPQVGLAEDGYQ